MDLDELLARYAPLSDEDLAAAIEASPDLAVLIELVRRIDDLTAPPEPPAGDENLDPGA